MSRSYKHTPYCGDKKTRWKKRQANKAFRRMDMDDEVPPSMHRKASESWNICDFYSKIPLDDWMNLKNHYYSKAIRDMDDDEREEMWHKSYRRK